MRIALFILALLTPTIASANEEIFSDGRYYVYKETKSCALYADFANGDMLRLSYRGSEETVFFTLFSDEFLRMPIDGHTFTIMFATDDDPNNMIGNIGFIVQNKERKGLNTSGGVEILEFLQGANVVTIYGERFLVMSKFQTLGIDKALKVLKRCGADK